MRANPLRRAFAVEGNKPKQGRAVPALGAVEQLPETARLDPAISKPAATLDVGSLYDDNADNTQSLSP